MIRTVQPPAPAHPPLLRSPGVAAGLPLAGPTPAARDAAMVRRATALREDPSEQGRSVATLPAESTVTRLPQRQGAWVQVRTEGGATGWVHLFDLGPAARAVAGTPSTASLTTNAQHGIAGRVENPRLTEAQAREYARAAQWETPPGEPLPAPAADPAAAPGRR